VKFVMCRVKRKLFDSYLEFRKIKKEQAAQIHELVGGRIIHLKCIADTITASKMSHFKVCEYRIICYVENGVSF